ncbi:MAG TPA: hypothetical protein VE028_04100 [Nitratidesulfovibrio sp.]|nr:hypothetical protein [Nitratidesulfovibrio sp.]
MNLVARVTTTTYPTDNLPHKCMYCRHLEYAKTFSAGVGGCTRLANRLRDEGHPIVNERLLVKLDGGECCEVWDAMTEAQAREWHDDETVAAYAQCWG